MKNYRKAPQATSNFIHANSALSLKFEKRPRRKKIPPPPDLSEMKAVIVDAKTTIFVKRGTPQNEIEKKIKLYTKNNHL